MNLVDVIIPSDNNMVYLYVRVVHSRTYTVYGHTVQYSAYKFVSGVVHYSMEELKWSGTGGSIFVIPVLGIRCVHYIEQKDGTARFATGDI